MGRQGFGERRGRLAAAAVLGGLSAAASAHADGPSFEIYGFAQADYIQDFNRVDPNWDATLRPSKIPTTPGEFGADGQSIISVRQTRFGVQASQPVAGHDLMVKFEFDLFGVGVDEGQTTFRLRHAYGTWGPILAGQTNSVFMDGDTFPNVIDYWGPNGMVFLRNPQIRYTYKAGPSQFAIAVEKPGNDIDPGQIREIDPDLGANVQGSETIPDFTAHYRYDGGWGHVQLAGILRRVGYDTLGTTNNRPKGDQLGWGVNATANIKTWKNDVLHLAAVYGDGIASYMNDGGVDLAPDGPPIVSTPISGLMPVSTTLPPGVVSAEAVPLLGLVAYYDHYWSSKFSTSLGWSQTRVDNTALQEPSAFRSAQYASANLLFTPDKHLLMGAEFLWGQREDFDRATGHDARVQFSVKYSFTSKDFFH